MAQRRLKGVLLGFASEVIAARAKVSRAEDHSLREFPFHVEVILERIRKLRVVRRREKVKRLGQQSILWVLKLRENEFLQSEEGRQQPVEFEHDCRGLVALDAEPAPHHSFSAAEDVPCKACLG